MNTFKRITLFTLACALTAFAFAGCTTTDNGNSNTTAVTTVSPPPSASPSPQVITETGRPEKIVAMMKDRGAQDEAKPVLSFVSPREGATIAGSTVEVKLNLSGDLKGYQPHKDPATNMGNHIHVILDNQPYEAYYDLGQPFELRNVTEGKHTLRVFASRPWHESYKNDGSFQMVTFNVKGGGNASQPTTTNGGAVMANNNKAAVTTKLSKNADAGAAATVNLNANAGGNANANANAAASPAAREGKDMPASAGGAVDPKKPLLTYSRPKGEYKGDDANAIMLDFWLSNAKLVGDGGTYRVRYSVDGGEEKIIEKWQPIWLTGWTSGKHTIEIELVDKDGNKIDNGGYNATSRDITVTK
jgi:hypothetical protein